jgi:hypothetical protein
MHGYGMIGKSEFLTKGKCVTTPQIFDCAQIDDDAQRVTQGFVFVGGVLTLPGLFLALSGLMNTQIAYYGAIISGIVAAVFLMFVWWSWAGVPLSLEIHADQLVIKRRWWRAIRVPYRTIEAVTILNVATDLQRSARALNAGVFGYQGSFTSARYGRLFCMVTDRDRTIAIARHQSAILIVSPYQPSAFLAALRESINAKG